MPKYFDEPKRLRNILAFHSELNEQILFTNSSGIANVPFGPFFHVDSCLTIYFSRKIEQRSKK